MPVQKTDLTAKKKKLEEMRERERQLTLELDKHMNRPSSATPGSTTSKKQVQYDLVLLVRAWINFLVRIIFLDPSTKHGSIF